MEVAGGLGWGCVGNHRRAGGCLILAWAWGESCQQEQRSWRDGVFAEVGKGQRIFAVLCIRLDTTVFRADKIQPVFNLLVLAEKESSRTIRDSLFASHVCGTCGSG